jgi:hypothetical protein
MNFLSISAKQEIFLTTDLSPNPLGGIFRIDLIQKNAQVMKNNQKI